MRESHHGVFLVSGLEEVLAIYADLDSFSSVVAPLGPFVQLPKVAAGGSPADVFAIRSPTAVPAVSEGRRGRGLPEAIAPLRRWELLRTG